jgi:hypothetical protein
MNKVIKNLIAIPALAAAALMANPTAVRSDPPAEAQSLETRLQDATAKRYEETQHKKAQKITLEKVEASADTYGAVTQQFPRSASNLSKDFVESAKDVWYGFATIDGKKFAVKYDLKKQNELVRTLAEVDANEESYIRKMMDFSDVIAPQVKIDDAVAKRIATEPDKLLGEYVAKAKTSKDWGKNITDDLAKSVDAALKSAGQNKHTFIEAMSVMDNDELSIALAILPEMTEHQYGSFQDGQRRPDIENTSAAVRYDGEHDFGGERHIFTATKELLKGATSAEEAIARIAKVGFKLVRHAPGKSANDSSWIDVVYNHGDKLDGIALVGHKMLQAAGIPSMRTALHWADQDAGRHRCNFVELDGKVYTFLAGDEDSFEGKTNIHVYDINDPRTANKDAKGTPRLAKAWKHDPAHDSRTDITDKLTMTTEFSVKLDRNLSDKQARLCVYGPGGRGADEFNAAIVKADGTAEFKNIGYLPNVERNPHGPLYVIVAEGRVQKTPLVLTKKGLTFVNEYDPNEKRDEISLPGFEKDTDFEVGIYEHGAFSQIGTYHSDDKGNLKVNAIENDLLQIRKGDNARLYTIRPDGKGFVADGH